MKEITIDTITNDEEYTVPKTEKNITALMNADYTKPMMIVLEDEDDDIVCILSTEVQAFYTEGDEYDNKDDRLYDEGSPYESSDDIFSGSSSSFDMKEEKSGWMARFRR